MPAVVLDSEAVVALADRARGISRRRAMHVLAAAARLELPVRVPSAVLAEVYRGTRADAGIDRVLDGRGVRVVTTGRRMARTAGGLRHRDRLDSCHVVDCLVVATSVGLGGGLIATADPLDIRRLARSYPNVEVLSIDSPV